MDRFEYKCVYIFGWNLKMKESVLNKYGKEGWELVCVLAWIHYLKRKIH